MTLTADPGLRGHCRHDGPVRLGPAALRPGRGHRAAGRGAIGVVPADKAFAASATTSSSSSRGALIVSAAVARSGIIEVALQPHRAAHHLGARAGRCCWSAPSTVLSAFVKNIGALAMMIPIAFQMAKRSNARRRCFLMPMAFGSLLGGTMTLIGTSPNIIVSRLREEIIGEPFSMFDFTPVGLGLAAAGVLFLRLGYRLLPRDRHRTRRRCDEAIDIKDYVTEARVTEESTVVGQDASAICASIAAAK